MYLMFKFRLNYLEWTENYRLFSTADNNKVSPLDLFELLSNSEA